MAVRRPAWWYYAEACENGHEWGPGRVYVSFTLCGCPPVEAAHGDSGAGHLTVQCAEPGCGWEWYDPPHKPTRRAELPCVMGDAPGPQHVSQLPVVCPLCRQVHERCEFRAGAVYCVRAGCRNPHHCDPGDIRPIAPNGPPGL